MTVMIVLDAARRLGTSFVAARENLQREFVVG
jgi:hypothetical protein